jgi:anti-sigma B factor antagonist
MNSGIFEVEQIGSTMVVTPTEDLTEFEFDRIEASALQVLEKLENGNVQNLVVDLQRTKYYGSTALGFFVKLWKRVKTNGGQMVFCGVSDQEQEVLRATHLDQLWPQQTDREQALAAIEQTQ